MLASYLELFPLRNASAVKRPGETKWRAVSRFHYLSDEEICQCVELSAKLLRSVSCEPQSRFLILEVPASSKYHSADFLCHIKSAFREEGVELAAYQFENDWYLYIYFSDLVAAEDYAILLANWFELAGCEIGPNTLVIHPSARKVPLPLQPGFSWLDEDANVVARRDDLSLYEALKLFHSDRSRFQVSSVLFEQIDRTVQESLASTQLAKINPCKLDSSEPAISPSPICQDSAPSLSHAFLITSAPEVAPKTASLPEQADSALPQPIQNAPQLLIFPDIKPTKGAKPKARNKKTRQLKSANIKDRAPPDTG